MLLHNREASTNNIPSNSESGLAVTSSISIAQENSAPDGVPFLSGASRLVSPQAHRDSFSMTDTSYSNNELSRLDSSEMMEFGGSDYGFMDDEAWVTMFASAGFSLEQGVFFS